MPIRDGWAAEGTDGENGIDDLLALVGLVGVELLGDDGRRGCLAVNSTGELGFGGARVVEMAQRCRDIIRSAVRKPLERSADRGEIDEGCVEVYVDTTMSYLMPAARVARGGAPPQELERHLGSMRRLIVSWRAA